MLPQQVVDEAVAPANPLDQAQLGGMLQEAGVIPGGKTATPKHKAQHTMLDRRLQPEKQPKNQLEN